MRKLSEIITEACRAAMFSNGKTRMTYGLILGQYLPDSPNGWRYDQAAMVWREAAPGTRVFPEPNGITYQPDQNQ